MLDFLYYLIVFPLESAMQAILVWAHEITGSWGYSLVLLSLVVNIVLIPFYHLAETWQQAERDIQHNMAPKLAEIKQVFHGRERYMMLRTLYRQHGYRPWFALRTSCGLMLQVPFFFAAYHLLYHAPELAGVSFYCIRDLSMPDALFAMGEYSLNVLPFVMTAVNLLSASVYTSRLTTRDKVQLYGLAALFLVLLYGSSAALLVYWTCNNVFSLGKNIAYGRYYSSQGWRIPTWALSCKVVIRRLMIRINAFATFVPSWFAGAAGIVALGIAGGAFAGLRYMSLPVVVCLVLGGALLAVGAFFLRICQLRQKTDKIYASISWYLLVFFLSVGFCTANLLSVKKVDELLSAMFYYLVIFDCCMAGILILLMRPVLVQFHKLAATCQAACTAELSDKLAVASLLIVGSLVFVYGPAKLYESDVSFFYMPLPALMAGCLGIGLLFLVPYLLFYRFAGKAVRPFFAVTYAFVAVLMFLYVFVAAGDYGTMDGHVLTDPALLRSRWSGVVDVAVVLAGVGILLVAIRKKYMRPFVALLQSIYCALLLVSVYFCFVADPGVETTSQASASRLPEYNDRLLTLSKNGTNVFVLMLDMFTGGHMEKLLVDNPALFDSLDGFTWYSDTISSGSTTLLSIAAMLGGEEYTPSAINARKPANLHDAMHEGFSVLPVLLAPKGYDIAYADVDSLQPDVFARFCPRAQEMLIVGTSFQTAYTRYWRSQKGLASAEVGSQSPFLCSVGLFQAAPWVLRWHIYDRGSWLGSQDLRLNRSEGPWAFIDSLSTIAKTQEQGNTFKFVASMVTHYPWELDPNTCMPAPAEKRVVQDGIVMQHLYTERCALRGLERFFHWMKEQGVYDNTMIILLSDHDGNDSNRLGPEFADLRKSGNPIKPDALLMVKPPQIRGRMLIDKRPMSSADLVPLLCHFLDICQEGQPFDFLENDRIRTHDAGLASIRRHKKDRFVVTPYRIDGPLSDRKSWQEETK